MMKHMKDVLFGIGELNTPFKDYFDGNSYCKTITSKAGPILTKDSDSSPILYRWEMNRFFVFFYRKSI